MFKNKKVALFFLLIFILLYFVLSFLFSASFFMADDPGECIMWSLDIKHFFMYPTNYNYFSGFLCKLFGSYIPKLMGIHPSDFKSFCFCFIQSMLFLLISFYICRLFYQKKKLDYPFIVYFLLSFSLLFAVISVEDMLIWLYPGLARMLFPAIFFVFLILLLSNIIKARRVLLQEKIVVSFLTVLCSLSNEMIAFSTITLYVAFFIYQYIRKSFYIEKFFLLACCFFSGISLFFYRFAFFRKVEGLGPLSFDYFLSLQPLVKEFFLCYIKYVINGQIFLYVFIIILSLFLLTRGRKEQRYLNVGIISLIAFSVLALLIFFAMLFFMGKTHYSGGYWCQHAELLIMFNIFLLSTIFILFREIIQQGLIKRKYFIVGSLILTVYLSFCNFKHYSLKYDEMQILKKECYKIEKIFRLAFLQQRIALLPDSIYQHPYLWHLYPENENMGTNREHTYFQNDGIVFFESFEEKSYTSNGFRCVSESEAYEEYKKYGGIFSESELQNPIFSALLNDDFLLNKVSK